MLDAKFQNENLTYEQRVSALTSRVDFNIFNSKNDINTMFKSNDNHKNRYYNNKLSTQNNFRNTSSGSFLKSSMKRIENISKMKHLL